MCARDSWYWAAFMVVSLSAGARADSEVQLVASEPVVLVHPPVIRPSDNHPSCLAFVNGDTLLATGATSGILIWDVAKGELRHSLAVKDRGVDTLVIDPRGTFLVAGCASGRIQVWDTRTWKEVRTLGAASGTVCGLAISPDGTILASASHDGQKGDQDQDFAIILWNLSTGQKLRTLALKPPALGTTVLAFMPDGKQIMAGQDRLVRIWDVATGKDVRTVELPGVDRSLGSLALRHDGRQLATGVFEPRIRIWDTQTWKQLHAWDAHGQEKPPRQGVSYVNYSPDGKLVLSGGMDGTACVWQASTGQRLLQLESGGRWVTGVALSADGRLLAATNMQGTASIWRITKK